MGKWTVVFTKLAQKDARKIASTGLRENAERLFAVLRVDPFQSPPTYEKLVGDLKGFYSRRINIKHRLVYEVLKEKMKVKILRMWSHYE